MAIVKTVKVSDKGQISIPLQVREAAGIYEGDELILVQKDDKILLEKSSSALEDDFRDIMLLSEKSLREIWDNEEDDIWAEYLQWTKKIWY